MPLEKRNLEQNTISLQRKATIYIKENGFQICKKLNQNSRWTASQIIKQFKEDPLFIQKLESMGLLNYLNESDEYKFSIEEKNNLLTQFYRKKIIDWSIKYFEEELQNLDGYRDFIHLIYKDDYLYQCRFFKPLISLSLQFFDKIKYWKEIESKNGQLQFYLIGKKYFETYDYVQRRKYIENYYNNFGLGIFDEQISKIKNKIKKYDNLTQFNNYNRLGNHFSLCFNNRCEECGGNILNTMILKIEPIRKKIIDILIFKNELENLKKLPYNMDLHAIESQAEHFKELHKIGNFEEYCKDKNLNWTKRSQKTQSSDFIPAIIEHTLRTIIYKTIDRMYKTKLMSLDSNRKLSKLYIRILKEYKKSSIILKKIVKPLTLLNPIGRRLNDPYIYDKTVFHKVDKEIKKIGRKGEWIVSEGLKEKYRNNKNIQIKWVNEEGKGTGTEYPYDILIIKPSGNEYIEVKTSHSDEKVFSLSQKELNHAKKNRSNYFVYLITSLGKRFDTELEIIENVYEKIKEKRLQTISRKIKVK